MKIYKPQPVDVIRVAITQQGQQTTYMSLCDTTQDKVIASFKKWLKPHCAAFPEGKVTRVDVREAKGGENGKSKSFKFYGLTPVEAYNVIIKFIE